MGDTSFSWVLWGGQGNQLGRRRHKGKNNIKIYLRVVELGGMDWINLAQGGNMWLAVVNAVMNLRFPYNAGNLQVFTICINVVYIALNCCNGMSHCLCSELVEFIVII
jgi:hypothetical protein